MADPRAELFRLRLRGDAARGGAEPSGIVAATTGG